MAQENFNRSNMNNNRNSYSGSNNTGYYSSGSLAYKLDTVPSYNNDYNDAQQRKKERELRRNERNKIKTPTEKSQPKTRKERKEALKLPGIHDMYYLKCIGVGIFIFFGVVLMIMSKVSVDNVSLEVRRTREEVKNLKEINAILSAELTDEIDLNFVKEEATNRLNMSEPQSYQLFYIDVPKQSYTIQHNSGE